MPTIRRCCIVGCNSNSRLNPNLQFFQFPRPENPFYKLWTQACHASLSRILPFKKPVLCAEHFAPHCIGGRRLTSSAVPSLKLDVPSDLKTVEQQSMVEEIERSRKCAYINAVVYEWLVRANLNPQLRGSITHGMIKEKADTAKRIIGCDTFTADNRWLNRFRESHLAGFAQKLASNQLKPMGPSLWIPDIVQELQHMFPPTNSERMDNFENVPEQYVNYMKQYGEYEEDDEGGEQEQQPPSGYEHGSNGYAEPHKMPTHSYYHPQQQQPPYEAQHSYYQQHSGPPPPPPPHHPQPPVIAPPPSHANAYNPYGHPAGVGLHHPASSYNAYHDYYANERHQQPPYQPHPAIAPPPPMPPHHSYHNGGYHPSQQTMAHPPPPPPQRPMSHSPVQQQRPTPPPQPIPQQFPTHPPQRPSSHSPALMRSSPIDPLQYERTSSSPAVKRPYNEDQSNSLPPSKRASPIINESQCVSRSPPPSIPTAKTPPQPNEANESNSNDNFKIKLPPLANRSNNATPTPPPQASSTPTIPNNANSSRSSSPKSQTDKTSATANGHASNGSPTPSSSVEETTAPKELETYAQALEYLKPLEDFALFKENFRAIGLISQLETILKKYNRPPVSKKAITNGCN